MFTEPVLDFLEEGMEGAGVLDVAVGVADVDVVAAAIGLEVSFNVNCEIILSVLLASQCERVTLEGVK